MVGIMNEDGTHVDIHDDNIDVSISFNGLVDIIAEFNSHIEEQEDAVSTIKTEDGLVEFKLVWHDVETFSLTGELDGSFYNKFKLDYCTYDDWSFVEDMSF
jgi:hypothetical protein